MNPVLKLLKNNSHVLLLAPMAELTHSGFRHLLEDFGGCDIHFTEMISSDLLVNGTPFKSYYLSGTPGRERLVYQLMGSRADNLIKAADMIIRRGARAIDINMGCSAPDILKKGAGCALMRTPESAWQLVRDVRSALPEDVLLSSKIRLGEKEDSQFLKEYALALQEAGCGFISLHPKIRKDRMSRLPRWSHVGDLASALDIPVVGNGHITSVDEYKTAKSKYNPAGIMIGRGAVQSPWLFRQIKDTFISNDDSAVSSPLKKVDLLETAEKAFEYIETYQPEEFHLSRAQRFSLYFHKNFTFGYRLHDREVQFASSLDEVHRFYQDYFERNPGERYKDL